MMKTLLYTLAILVFFAPCELQAQPTKTADTGCDEKNQITKTDDAPLIRFLYFPNLQAYFDQKTADYIFQVKGEWVKAKAIPENFKGYSIYNKVTVPIKDYFDDCPYEEISKHKKKFPADYKGRYIREYAQSDF